MEDSHSNSNIIRELFGNGGFWQVSKTIVRYLDHKNAHTASIFFAELLDQKQYFETRNELKNIEGCDGFFYVTGEKIEKRTLINKRSQKNLSDLLVNKGLVETTIFGIPAKKYFKISDNASETLVKFSIAKSEILVSQKTRNYNEEHIRVFNKLKTNVFFSKNEEENFQKNGEISEDNLNSHEEGFHKANVQDLAPPNKKLYGVDKAERSVLSAWVDECYKLYPTKCSIKNVSTGKNHKNKSKIESIILDVGYETVKVVILGYLKECRDEKVWLKNFSTFLNNFPDPEIYADLKAESETFIQGENLCKHEWEAICEELDSGEKVWIQQYSPKGRVLNDPVYASPQYAINRMGSHNHHFRFVKRGKGQPK